VLVANGHDASAVAGQKSQFDIIADGKLVFSKQSAGRFPEEDEVVAALAP
jgi:hypothetical protein